MIAMTSFRILQGTLQRQPILEPSLLPYTFIEHTDVWWRCTVVERLSLASELSLSCARPAADE